MADKESKADPEADAKAEAEQAKEQAREDSEQKVEQQQEKLKELEEIRDKVTAFCGKYSELLADINNNAARGDMQKVLEQLKELKRRALHEKPKFTRELKMLIKVLEGLK